jgi:hypothetical protein
MRRLALFTLALGACTSAPKLEDLSWGEPVAGDYEAAVARARRAIVFHFRHLDPDRTREDEGDLWSLWRFDRGEFNRSSFRRRGRVRVERAGDDRFRVGVAVFQQLSDNIQNPGSEKEARWVRTTRRTDLEEDIRRAVEARYRDFAPSEDYERRKAETDSTTPRRDLIDRYEDVDLEESGTTDPKRRPARAVGPEKDEPK